jgi:hypothetical protein
MDYHVRLAELERSAHVPVEEQVLEHPTSPPVPDLVAEGERDRLVLLRVGIPGA